MAIAMTGLGDVVRMPEATPDGPGLDALFPDSALGRDLRATVTRDGKVVFILRRPTGALSGAPLAVFELGPDEWRTLARRVGRMLADPERWARACAEVGRERAVRREDALLRAFERVLADLAEEEP